MKGHTLGQVGERVAANHLRRLGYRILARNWRCSPGEVDIVARHGDEYVFVEVKARRGRAFGAPEEAVTPRKLKRLQAVAHAWLAEHVGDRPVNWRIEVVAVEFNTRNQVTRVEVIPLF